MRVPAAVRTFFLAVLWSDMKEKVRGKKDAGKGGRTSFVPADEERRSRRSLIRQVSVVD